MADDLTSIVDAAQQLLNLGDAWKIVNTQQSSALLRALHAELHQPKALVPVVLVVPVSVVAVMVEEMLLGLDQGGTSRRSWTDLQLACARMIGAVEAWRAAS